MSPPVQLNSSYVNAVLALEDGRFAAGTERGEVVIMSRSLELLARRSLGSPVNALSSGSNDTIVAGLDSGDLLLLRANDLSTSVSARHGNAILWCLDSDLVGGGVISGGGDRAVRSWSEGLAPLGTTLTLNSSVRGVDLHDSGTATLIGLYSGEVVLLDQAANFTSTIGFVDGSVRDVSWVGQRAAAATSKGKLMAWGPEGVIERSLSSSGLYALDWVSHWRVAAVGGTDGHLRLLDEALEPLASFNLRATVRSADSSNAGVIVGDSSGQVRLVEDPTPPTLLAASFPDGGPYPVLRGGLLNVSALFDEAVNLPASVTAVSDEAAAVLDFRGSTSGRMLDIEANVSGLAHGKWELRMDGVSDLAGNLASGQLGGFEIDLIPPAPASWDPPPGTSIGRGQRTFRMSFDEPLGPLGALRAAAKMPGGQTLAPEAVSVAGDRTLKLLFSIPEVSGTGQLSIDVRGARDVAGNLATPVTALFGYDGDPPIAEAGDEIAVAAGTEVVLDGSLSIDAWKARWEVDGESLTGVVARRSFEEEGIYLATLTVWDEAGNFDSDGVIVEVFDLTPPWSQARAEPSPTNRSPSQVRILATDRGGAGLRNVEVVASGPGGWWARQEVRVSGDEASASISLALGLDGTYVIQTTATDAQGNRQPSPTVSYLLLDRKGPLPKSVDPPGGDVGARFSVKVEFDEPVTIGTGRAAAQGIHPFIEAFSVEGATFTAVIAPDPPGDPVRISLEGLEDSAGNPAAVVEVEYLPGGAARLHALDFAMGAVASFSLCSLLWAWSLRPRSAARPAYRILAAQDKTHPEPQITAMSEEAPTPRRRAQRLASSMGVPPGTDSAGGGGVSEFDDAVRRLLDGSGEE